MGKKSLPAETPRKGVNTRITDDLRTRLEASAQENNRTLGSEIEHRLELSFKFEFGSTQGVSALSHSRAGTLFLQSIGSIFGLVLLEAKQRGFSELETRDALKGALEVIASRHLWTGQKPPDDAASYLFQEMNKLQPTDFGQQLASAHLQLDSYMTEQKVIKDFYSNKIIDHWSGNGTVAEPVPE